MVIAFFQKVLASFTSTSFVESSLARQWVFQRILDSLSPALKAKLEAQITVVEIYEAM